MMYRARFHALLIVAGLALAFGAAASAPAQEDKAPAAKQTDRYALPDGGVDKLILFIDGLKNYEPENIADFFAHREKAPKAIIAAANKILELEKDKKSDAYQVATQLLLEMRIIRLGDVKPPEQKAVLDELKARFAGKTLEAGDAQLAMAAARGLEDAGSKELAVDAYNSFAKLFAASGNEQLVGFSKMLAGSARRADLIGNEMKLTGTTLDGAKFDIKSLKGKVVLVDFWATWCGPCLAEYPNIKKNYELYNKRGFEVVGISIDQNRAALEQYAEETKIPWITLHDEGEDGNPTANYYGIMAIPAMMLVGRDGKVVSLQARGEELDRLLAEIIGPAEPKGGS